jgi:hypothetical protein
VFLGGLASLQNLCVDNTTNLNGVTPGGNSATGNTAALQSVTGMNRNTGGLMNIFGGCCMEGMHGQVVIEQCAGNHVLPPRLRPPAAVKRIPCCNRIGVLHTLCLLCFDHPHLPGPCPLVP